MSASLLWTVQERPLPALGWAAAFLFLAIEHDVRAMRIPNWLTLPGLLFALALAAGRDGWPGLGFALGGAAFGFALLFVPFALRWLGAGDVKAVMVLGALWGAEHLGGALWWMVVAGGALALGLLTVQGGLPDLIRRWASSLKLTLLTRRWTWFPPAQGSAAAGGIPFAVAMGIGALAYQLWGTPWS